MFFVVCFNLLFGQQIPDFRTQLATVKHMYENNKFWEKYTAHSMLASRISECESNGFLVPKKGLTPQIKGPLTSENCHFNVHFRFLCSLFVSGRLSSQTWDIWTHVYNCVKFGHAKYFVGMTQGRALNISLIWYGYML